MHPPKKIVAALAFGDYSKGVFNYTVMLAKALNADVVIANIINERDVEAVSSISSMGYEVDGEHYVSSIRKEREIISEQFIVDSDFPADRVSIVIRLGNPVSELIKICTEEGADMIVMGPKGRTSLKNVLVGSVAEKVYQHSAITVVSYRENLELNMMEYSIPGYGKIRIQYLVLDYNGTLALDGNLLKGVKTELLRISEFIEIYVLTADTFGKSKAGLKGIPCRLEILPTQNQDQGKLDFIKKLGADKTACIGNGRNDRLMLREAALGIAVILQEGAATVTLNAADIVCADVLSALELFSNPLRLTATLRS